MRAFFISPSALSDAHAIPRCDASQLAIQSAPAMIYGRHLPHQPPDMDDAVGSHVLCRARRCSLIERSNAAFERCLPRPPFHVCLISMMFLFSRRRYHARDVRCRLHAIHVCHMPLFDAAQRGALCYAVRSVAARTAVVFRLIQAACANRLLATDAIFSMACGATRTRLHALSSSPHGDMLQRKAQPAERVMIRFAARPPAAFVA